MPKCPRQRHGHRLQQGKTRRHPDAMSSRTPKSTPCLYTKRWCQVIRSVVLLTPNHVSKPEDLMFQNGTLSGNQRPDLVTSLMNRSRSLRLPREMHLSRSSSNVLRPLDVDDVGDVKMRQQCKRCRWNMWAMKMILNIFIDNSLLEGTPDSTTNQPKNSKNN